MIDVGLVMEERLESWWARIGFEDIMNFTMVFPC